MATFRLKQKLIDNMAAQGFTNIRQMIVMNYIIDKYNKNEVTTTSAMEFGSMLKVGQRAMEYHIKELIECGYIEKSANGMIATKKGMDLVR